ncbi:Uma2 family endonuclease [Nocardia sp. NPDC052278]|uniref:Uma2 family endonuclease n=1 Tax=unclassified Nocardia TaxID=2637762 RepID=UPI0036C7C450
MSAVFDWAREENLQPEPITVEIWKELPEDFCRLVEVENGEAVRAEEPSRPHHTATFRLAHMVDRAIAEHVDQYRDECLDTSIDFDMLLWEAPRTTIRRPDLGIYDCAPADLRPLPAHLVKLVIEIVSPGTTRIDLVEKKAEYAIAGIPWYWIVRIGDNSVSMIEIFVLDHVLGQYRPHAKLTPNEPQTTVDLPIRITIDWTQLTGLAR